MNPSTSPAGDLSTADGGRSDAGSSGSVTTGAVVLVVAAVVLVGDLDVLVVVDVPGVVVVVVSVPIGPAVEVIETVGGLAWPQAGAPAPNPIPANAIKPARPTGTLDTRVSPCPKRSTHGSPGWRPHLHRGIGQAAGAMLNTEVVRAAFDAYLAQDERTATRLLAEDFVFTSPQDDRIDKAAYLERCFPTADRLVSQEILELVGTEGDGVFILYEYELTTGARHRNTEFITVREGQLVEVQVFFGGRV